MGARVAEWLDQWRNIWWILAGQNGCVSDLIDDYIY